MIRELRFEIKYLFRELFWFVKHPKRKNWADVTYHLWKIYSELTYPFKCLSRGISNLWTWFPIIWTDRQFDHCFFYDVLLKKLTLMEEFFYSDKPHILHAKRYGRQIRVCRQLVEKLKDGNLEDEEYDKFYAKFGHSPDIESILVQSDEDGKPELYRMAEWEFSTTGIPYDEWHTNFRIYMDRARTKDVKYRTALFRIMGKCVERWWD